MAKEIAISKRVKISKAQQYTMIEVLVASLVLGLAIVLSIWLIKYITFNTKVISAKNDAIESYEKTIKNVGICNDINNDGKYSDDELQKCDPNSTKIKEGTLRYNVMYNLANNASLESVARGSLAECYDSDKNKIDFNQKYQEATSESDKSHYLELTRVCSALRVIPDALPAVENREALMASLNDIFIISDWTPTALTPGDDSEKSKIEGLNAIPVTLSIEANSNTTSRVLDNIEKSIREFDISKASIEWSSNDTLSLQARARSYYSSESSMVKERKTVYASDAAKKAKK